MPRLRIVALLVFPLIVGHVLFPLALVVQLGWRAHAPREDWLPMLCFAGSFIALIYVSGAWSWFGRVPQVALPVLLVAAVAMRWIGPAPDTAGRSVQEAAMGRVDRLLSYGLGSLLLVLFLCALRGRRLPAGALDFHFPLRGGTFIVGQGGASKVVNYHFGHPSQRYALDLLMLNAAGVRARGFYPAALDRYAAWDAQVVSPCNGVVAAVVDQYADLAPPQRDPAHPAGNHVAIEAQGATIYLAHLRHGSITVRAGDRVRAGQPIGRVGNSGNTTEPHLHVHAEAGPYPGRFSGRPGMPIRFGGRFLVRNDRIVVPAIDGEA